MQTQFVSSPDGVKIAYDVCGDGPAIVLVHGGGSFRQEWHTEGYVNRLQENFLAISLYLRGHGESDMPTDPSDYTIDKMARDILSVADRCSVEQFAVWGFSYGGKIGRYLAAHSERVSKTVLMGTPMGPPVTDQIRNEIEVFCSHWPPILKAQRDGVLDYDTLSHDDRQFLQNFDVPVMMAWGRAMLDWPSIQPNDFLCPVLWLVGSEDYAAMASVREYGNALDGTKVQLCIVDGLTHEQVFEEIDEVFNSMLSFTQL